MPVQPKLINGHLSRPFLFGLVVLLALLAASSTSRAQTHVIDILSNEYYPQLKDAWMFQINDQGLAAGYIATASASGPYLPATYSGNGQFQTYGIQSTIYPRTVTGLGSDGTFGGNLYDADFNSTPYVFQNGSLEYLPFQASNFASLDGVSSNGSAYGGYTSETVRIPIFTPTATTLCKRWHCLSMMIPTTLYIRPEIL